MPVDAGALDTVNERLFRLEAEVDGVKSDLSEQKIAVARITEQVSAHEKRGEERHVQLMSALNELKQDYRGVFHAQAEDAKAHLKAQLESDRERSANQTKIVMAILGLLGSVLGAMYGFDWSQTPETPTTQPSTQPAPTAP
jgi:biopolymer transport protein ExbB/TolQ